jgi:hypothetical protein
LSCDKSCFGWSLVISHGIINRGHGFARPVEFQVT